VNAFVLLAIAAGIVLLIVEGAFLARLQPEQIIRITKRSVLAAIAWLFWIVIMGKLHWIFVPLGLHFRFWTVSTHIARARQNPAVVAHVATSGTGNGPHCAAITRGAAGNHTRATTIRHYRYTASST